MLGRWQAGQPQGRVQAQCRDSDRLAWELIQTLEATSPTQVELTYAKPSLSWFAPIAGSIFGSIIPSHVWKGIDKDMVNAEFAVNPIGTGPYILDAMVPGDFVVCSINERYREPSKPFFATVRFQGGGDSAAAAQDVLQSGEWDAAPNLILMPAVAQEMESAGNGKIVAGMPTSVERIMFNFSDPNVEIDGEQSSLGVPHPFLTCLLYTSDAADEL